MEAKKETNKIYLGDNVYVDYVDHQVILTIEGEYDDGHKITNTIYLTSRTMSKFIDYFVHLIYCQ